MACNGIQRRLPDFPSQKGIQLFRIVQRIRMDVKAIQRDLHIIQRTHHQIFRRIALQRIGHFIWNHRNPQLFAARIGVITVLVEKFSRVLDPDIYFHKSTPLPQMTD